MNLLPSNVDIRMMETAEVLSNAYREFSVSEVNDDWDHAMEILKRVVPTYVPLGVADSDGTIGVISNANGGLDKLDLQSGNTIWHSSVGVHPLLIWGKVVLVKVESQDADTLEVVSIDLESCKPAGIPLHFRMPDWSNFSSPDLKEFCCRMSAEGSHRLLLEWTVTCAYAGGATAPLSIRNEKRKRVNGVSRLDMLTQRCETLPQSSTNKMLESVDSKFSRVSYRMQGEWSEQPFECDAKIVQLVGDDSSLFMIRRDLNRIDEQESRLLFKGQWIAPTVTPDGSFLIVLGPTEDNFDKSNWEVISLVSGELVCRFESELQPDLCCVVGKQLFYVATDFEGQTQYCNRSLVTGQLLWQKSLPVRILDQNPPPLSR